MLVVRTVEGRTHPLDQFVGTEQAIGFHHPTLAMHPPGLYRVQPRALLGQLAPYDPHAFCALLGCPVMLVDPSAHFMAYVPARVVPYQHPHLLTHRP